MSALCLVTGGAGFIGSHLVEALTAAGRSVRVLDNFDTGLHSNLEGIRPFPEVVKGDVSDSRCIQEAVAGVSLVFHLAALASVQKSVEAPVESHRVCATGTLELLDAARRAGVRRVVYAGSSSAYGVPENDVQTEAEPLRPLSPYAAAKLAGEMYLQAFAATYGVETVRLRFFNVFGPRQRADSPYSGVIAIFAALLMAGRVPTVHGDGLQSRDFVYVTDVIQALLKAGTVPDISGKVYNVGSGQSITVLDLVAALNCELGTEVQPVHGPARPGDVRYSRADITLARHELGFEPQVPFAEGLAKTLAWYQGGQAT